MVILTITSAIAIATICYCIFYNNKYNALKVKVFLLESVCQHLKDTNIAIAAEYSRIKQLILTGEYNIEKRRFDDHIDVVGADNPKSELFFVITRFKYDPDDADAMDFADRSAEELIEFLQSIK